MLVKNCACGTCADTQARGRMPANAPVRDCGEGEYCPCHMCGRKFRNGADPVVPLNLPSVNPVTVVKLGAGVVIAALVYGVVMWVMANIAMILTVTAFCAAGAGLGWFLFINPDSPLKTWRARRAARAVEERKALPAAAKQLPPASQQSLPSASQSSLPEMRVKVLGYTVNKPVPQKRKPDGRK